MPAFMHISSYMGTPPRNVRLIVSALTAGLALVASGLAAAASLGPIDLSDVSVLSKEVSVDSPIAITGDTFEGCHNRLEGWTDSLGNEWTDHWGVWQCLGGGLVRSRLRIPLAHATLDLGRSDGIIITTAFERVSTQSNRSGPGISLFSDGFFHMYVIYERDADRVTLGKWSPWSNEVLATAPMSGEVAEMSVIVDQPALVVLIDGSQVLTYDLGQLTPGEQGYLLQQTRFGLEADRDNWSRFSSFRVETLP